MANGEASLLLKIKQTGEEALTHVVATMGDIKEMAQQVAESLAAPFEAFGKLEEATNSLSMAMVNNGMYTKELSDAYAEQAKEISENTLFTETQVTAAQAVLQTQIGQIKITDELTAAITNYAAAQKMDLVSAADQVGKAIGSNTNALMRHGIEVTQTGDKTQKLAQVIEGLNDKFGGQAEAATEGLGSVKKLGIAFEEMQVTIGRTLAPQLEAFIEIIQDMGADFTDNTFLIDAMKYSFTALIVPVVGLKIAFNELLALLGGGLSTALEAVVKLVNGDFKGAWEAAKNGASDTWSMVVSEANKGGQQLDKIFEATTTNQKKELDKQEANIKASDENRARVAQDEANKAAIKELQRHEADRKLASATLTIDEETKFNALAAWDQKQFDLATDSGTKLMYLQQKNAAEDAALEAKRAKETLALRQSTFGTIATLSNSHNSALAAIGKAAGITQIAIDTPIAISKALAAFPPPFNFIAAGLVGVAMAAQAANIAGVQLAEGGIVLPRPGGTQATIGEAGQAEAVIPLNKMASMGLGGGGGNNISITINGGMLGDPASAREFAIAVDRHLLELRRNNESVAFDSRVV